MSEEAPGIECELQHDGDRARVVCSGELDVATVGSVETRVLEALHGGARRLVLDLGGLTFMASAGLRLVLGLAGRAGAGEFELEVVPGPPAVQRLFELTSTADQVPWARG